MSENPELQRTDKKNEITEKTEKKETQVESKEAQKSKIETPMYGVRVVVQKESKLLDRIKMQYIQEDRDLLKEAGIPESEFRSHEDVAAGKILQVYKIRDRKMLVGNEVWPFGWLPEEDLILWKGRKVVCDKGIIKGFILEDNKDTVMIYNPLNQKIETPEKSEVQENIGRLYGRDETSQLTGYYRKLVVSVDHVGKSKATPQKISQVVEETLKEVLSRKNNDILLNGCKLIAQKQLDELQLNKNNPEKIIDRFASYAQEYARELDKKTVGETVTIVDDRYELIQENSSNKN